MRIMYCNKNILLMDIGTYYKLLQIECECSSHTGFSQSLHDFIVFRRYFFKHICHTPTIYFCPVTSLGGSCILEFEATSSNSFRDFFKIHSIPSLVGKCLMA